MIEGLSAIGTDMSHRILPGVGHYVPDEAPEELARILAGFFDENG
jgi:pimeloyl-ACP methyl ester carboxylesterase